MIPFDVPSTMDAETARQVGEPKFRFPASEKACPLSFFRRVHLTTSHGGDDVSVSDWSSTKLELREAWRLCGLRKAGDWARGLNVPEEEIRDLKRRSKGRKEGVGLPRPGREATDGNTLLPREDTTEPCGV